MKTEVIRVSESGGQEAAVRRAKEVLTNGGLVVLPTETVYGVAARADLAEAVSRLRTVKERSKEKAFTLHLGSPERLPMYVDELSGLAQRLVNKGWPGPMTLIFAVSDPGGAAIAEKIPREALTNLYYDRQIGVRCPDHAVCQSILGEVDAPVIAASANKAGQPPPVDPESAQRNLEGEIELLIDSGPTRYAKASTIVRIDGSRYKILREGVLDAGIVRRLSSLRILMVCSGNTCRSPMAESLARVLLAGRLGWRPDELVDRGIVVTSAGTSGGVGSAAAHAVAVMRHRGIDLTTHSSALLTRDIVRQADYIYTMTRAHREAVLRLDPSAEQRAMLLAGDCEVLDPFGGSEADYEACAQVIETALRARLEEIPV